MTKKEQAALQAAIDRADLLAALRWTEPVSPDVPRPEGNEQTTGWLINSYAGEVHAAWSERVRHGYGEPSDGECRNGSQGGRKLYATRLRALRAVRHEMEIMYAEKLREVDREIAKERANESPSGQGGEV